MLDRKIYTKFINNRVSKSLTRSGATFNGEPYIGSIVNMGVKNADGSICYILGIHKDIQAKIQKYPGDDVCVTVQERE